MKIAGLTISATDHGQRFFLDRDHSSHWFCVPVQNRQEWETWRAIDEDDERAWTPPPFSRPLDCHPSLMTFQHPEFL